jgi:ABC-type tungstate transport system permease subunit
VELWVHNQICRDEYSQAREEIVPLNKTIALLLLGIAALGTNAAAEDRSITVASTTSTEQSGLFG